MKIYNTDGDKIHEVDSDSLVGADLSNADLFDAILIGVDRSGADLRLADLEEVGLNNARFYKTKITKSQALNSLKAISVTVED